MGTGLGFGGVLLLLIVVLLLMAVRILREYERGVVLRSAAFPASRAPVCLC